MCQKGREPCQAMTEGTKEALGGDRSDLSPEKVRFEFWVYYVWWWVVVVVYSVSILLSTGISHSSCRLLQRRERGPYSSVVTGTRYRTTTLPDQQPTRLCVGE